MIASPGARRARRGRRPASAAGTSARRRGSPARPSPTSAEITPTSVTLGKSWPLAIICVPTRTSISPAAKRCESARRLPLRRTVSRSTRATRASGKALAHSASTRSVPKPTRSRYGAAHFARLRHRHRVVAVVAACRGRVPRVCTVSDTLQLGHSSVAALPAEDGRGEAAAVEQDERPARRARDAPPCAAAAGSDHVRSLLAHLLAHVDESTRRQRPIEHAALSVDHERVAPAAR